MTTVSAQPEVLTTRQLGLKTLNINQVAAVFDVSVVTVCVWRKGTNTRDPLQSCHDEATSRFPKFRVSELKRYAKRYGLEFARQPEEVLQTWVSVKPGPKPRNVESTAVVSPTKASKAAKKKLKH